MGLICGVAEGHAWWRSHAQLPSVLPLAEDCWRVFFSARDEGNRSRVLAIDLDPTAGMAVRARHFDTLLDRGALGAFDHEGLVTSQAVASPEGVLLYYTGITQRRDVRTAAAIGVAVSADGLRFERPFPGPVFSQGPHDPCFTAAPMLHQVGDERRLYYISGIGWDTAAGALEPHYGVRLLRSADGMIFSNLSEPVLADAGPDTYSIGRPWVARWRGQDRLWFSLRGIRFRADGDQPYHIASCALDGRGLAHGPFERVNFVNPPQPGDFDSWMQAYACLIPHGDRLIMFYNGDGFGAGGFGWAVLEE
jgi:hypothetical protein